MLRAPPVAYRLHFRSDPTRGSGISGPAARLICNIGSGRLPGVLFLCRILLKFPCINCIQRIYLNTKRGIFRLIEVQVVRGGVIEPYEPISEDYGSQEL